MEPDKIWTIHEDVVARNISHPQARNGSAAKCNDHIRASYMVGVDSRFRRKYYHKAIFAALVLVIMLLIIAIIVLAYYIHAADDICYSEECLKTSAMFLQNMDKTAHPCEDFFKYMCGNFEREHPLPDTSTSHDWFTEKQMKIFREIRKNLLQKVEDGEPQPVTQAKKLYKSCIDTGATDKLGFDPLYKQLKLFSLPAIPSILTQSDESKFNHFNWIKSIAQIKRTLGADKLIGLEIFADPKNRSVNYLAIGSPSQENDLPLVDDKLSKKLKRMRRNQWLTVRSATPIDDESSDNGQGKNEEKASEIDDDDEMDMPMLAYTIYMKEVIISIAKELDSTFDVDGNIDRITRIIQSTVNISRSIYNFIDIAENASKAEDRDGNLSDLIYIKVKDLDTMINEVVSAGEKTNTVHKYMTYMLNGLPEAYFDYEQDVILTSNADILYLKSAVKLIYETDSMELEAFLWWSIVEELILYTTSGMRQLYHEYTKVITGVEGVLSRSSYCTTSINKLMGYAVSYTIAEKDFMLHTKPKVERMLANIRSAFNNIIYHSWMDWETKERSLRKSDRMKSLIGFPEWILNKTQLERFYDGIRIKSDTWMENIIELLSWQFMDKLSRFRMKNEFDWAITPSNVNAFHTFQANAITIPLAILQFPFYNLGLEALNYGSIGTILSHELTHGFDDIGRHFDENGNKNYWWSNYTIGQFINRTECFKKQYNEYYLPEVDGYIDGENTLGENIADNGGLREAFYGYQYYKRAAGKEKKLPGFEHFSHEQLFFMSYGNLWCETMSLQGLKFSLEDSHCPGRIRLLGTLSNAKEFHTAFNCHVGQKYYRTDDQKCIIW